MNRDTQVFLYKMEDDSIHNALKELFLLSGYDKENAHTSLWNPLSTFIKSGQTVLIKPNMVLECSRKEGEDYYSVVTHPVLINAIVEYVCKALEGKGKIIIGDAPVNNADFEKLCYNMRLKELQETYRQKGVDVELVDFRLYSMSKDENGIIVNKTSIDNVSDYVEVKVDSASELNDIASNYENFRITEYSGKVMQAKHNLKQHRYCFHKSILEADVIVSIPKIKTHRKAGYTCAMKNWVGLNGNKDWLPHHTKFSHQEGGDEYLYPSIRKRLISKSWDIRWAVDNLTLQKCCLLFERCIRLTMKFKSFPDFYSEGSWWGNHTLPRTVNDLNKAVLYSDKSGNLQLKKQRTLFYVVDGIICGEGEGPMMATSKRCDMLLCGTNAYAIDLTVLKLMGFDSKKIGVTNVCESIKTYPIADFLASDVYIKTNLCSVDLNLATIRHYLKYSFIPSSGWKDHIELSE